jgi:hypothetical protein
MNGINEDELDVILARVFARHLIPFELRLAIWKLLDLGKCLRCNLLYQNKSMHGCELYGHSTCPRCIPTHFCLSLKDEMVFPHDDDQEMEICFRLSSAEAISRGMKCSMDTSHQYCAISGFSKAAIEPIRRALNRLSVIRIILMILMDYTPPRYFSLIGGKIEFIEGVFE